MRKPQLASFSNNLISKTIYIPVPISIDSVIKELRPILE